MPDHDDDRLALWIGATCLVLFVLACVMVARSHDGGNSPMDLAGAIQETRP